MTTAYANDVTDVAPQDLHASLSVVVADDHEAVRLGLTAVMTAAGHTVVAAVTSASEAVEAVRGRRVDVVLLDLHLPQAPPSLLGPSKPPSDTDAAEWALKQILDTPHPPTVVGVSGVVSADVVDRLRSSGLAGFAHKLASARELTAVIDAAVAAPSASSGLAGMPMDRYSEREMLGVMRKRVAVASCGLADEERELLALLAAGHTLIAAADELALSRSTANRRMATMMDKLGATTRNELLLAAGRLGVV